MRKLQPQEGLMLHMELRTVAVRQRKLFRRYPPRLDRAYYDLPKQCLHLEGDPKVDFPKQVEGLFGFLLRIKQEYNQNLNALLLRRLDSGIMTAQHLL